MLRKEIKGPVQSHRSFWDGTMRDAGAEHGGVCRLNGTAALDET